MMQKNETWPGWRSCRQWPFFQYHCPKIDNCLFQAGKMLKSSFRELKWVWYATWSLFKQMQHTNHKMKNIWAPDCTPNNQQNACANPWVLELHALSCFFLHAVMSRYITANVLFSWSLALWPHFKNHQILKFGFPCPMVPVHQQQPQQPGKQKHAHTHTHIHTHLLGQRNALLGALPTPPLTWTIAQTNPKKTNKNNKPLHSSTSGGWLFVHPRL